MNPSFVISPILAKDLEQLVSSKPLPRIIQIKIKFGSKSRGFDKYIPDQLGVLP